MEEAENRKFADNNVKPIFEKLMTDILVKKPANVIQFMKEWLDTKGAAYASGSQSPTKKPKKNGDESGSDSDEEDEDTIELLPKETLAEMKQKVSMRTSVSAEAYGQWNKKGEYKPVVVPKTAEQKERIKLRLSQAFMFSALDDKEQEIVVDAMEEKTFEAETVVIKQGDHGDNLYVVDSGSLECYKQFAKDQEPKLLKTYIPGESFGELALLYNAPRAATVKAVTKSVLISLDRECFNHIVKDAAAKKREKYEDFLGKLELLSTMDAYERSKIADAFKSLKFKKGDYVVKEGDKGDTFYFIESGEAVAQKSAGAGKPPQVVYHYKAGDYFGELALLRDTPRAASIIAESDLALVSLDRFSFKRLLGPLEDLLSRNFSKYELFTSK